MKQKERDELLYSGQLSVCGGNAAAIAVGIDEVGRGALAGPLTVAAVALPFELRISGLNDSKKLSAKRREELSAAIEQTALAVGIAHVEAAEIDRLGIGVALRRAMVEALAATGLEPDAVLIDGNPVQIHPKEQCIVKGDSKIACIAAASIVAKVCRDNLMVSFAEEFPSYGWESNKGYGSAAHIDAIKSDGLSRLHRRSFCGKILQEQMF